MNVTQYAQTSILVARTTETYRDAFVFRVQGVLDPDRSGVKNLLLRRKTQFVIKTLLLQRDRDR